MTESGVHGFGGAGADFVVEEEDDDEGCGWVGCGDAADGVRLR